MTFLPFSSAREIRPPPLVTAEKPGATSPSFNFNSTAFAMIFLFVVRIRRTGRVGSQHLRSVPDVPESRDAGANGGGACENAEPGIGNVLVPLQQQGNNAGHL